MTTQKYMIRAAKRLIQFSVLIAAVFALLILTGTSRIPADRLLHEVFTSWRGIVLLAAVIGWSAAYPRVAYITYAVPGDLARDRQHIDRAFAQVGYSPAGGRGDELIYRSSSALRRIVSMGEDAVTVAQQGDDIVLGGKRRQVVTVGYGLRASMQE